ncbi:MAG TPA: riboflavin synthase [bacterium]
MFTGLIEEVGTIRAVVNRGGWRRFTLAARTVLDGLSVDDSVAVSGVCLTVIALGENSFQVEAVAETLRKTTLESWQTGRRVNLERSLRLADRLGGHLVQGHVDDVGRVVDMQTEPGRLVSFELPTHLEKYVIAEGSIAIDGVSLTVARLRENIATVSLIPHTLQKTTLAELQVGSKVNIEVDVIGKYIEKLIAASTESKISPAWLQKVGFQ